MLILLGIALSVVAAHGLGIVPMFQRAPAVATMRQSGTGARGGRGVTRFRNALATGQVALGMVLLVAAGLMIRSHSELRRVDAGFSPSGVLTFEVGLPRIGYETREAAVQALNEMLAGIRSLPGVTTAGVANCLPLCGSWAGDAWRAQDAPPRPGEFPPIAATRRVSPGYLEALRVPVVAGRLLTQVDEDQRSGAAVISERLAGRLWPGEPAVGRLVYHGEPARTAHWYRVVGVVANTPVRELTDDPVPMAYLPLLHSDSTRGPGPWLMSAVVRTSIPPERLVESVRSVVAGVDPAVPLARVRTLQAIVDDAGSRTAFTMTLLVIAASVSLVLGCVGTYGVTSYMVTRRGAEFGIRMALGAQRGDISRIVARHTALVVGAGLIIGVGGALALTKLMRALLHGISPGDPATYLTMSALLAIAGVAAAWFPVRRAVRIPPAAVLRGD
jgi:putative ABC transport system permease protein